MADIALTTEGGRTARAAPAVAPPARPPRNWAWLGLVPFLSFLTLFLIIPAVSIFSEALRESDGSFGFSAMGEAFSGQNRDAFLFSIQFSAWAAATGVVVGGLLAYAAATTTRPSWVRSLVTGFSGVAANLGGVPLAFMFLTLLGRQGILTKVLDTAGFNPWDHGFGFDSVWGLVIVYSYFNIPLMLLITLPAIDGLRPAWREASANLGGTTWTYWRRVGLPVLAPSLLGGFLLLFTNSFSAYATAAALTDTSRIVSRRLSFFLGGDISTGQDAIGYSLAGWMVVIAAVCMTLYWFLRKRAERWQA